MAKMQDDFGKTVDQDSSKVNPVRLFRDYWDEDGARHAKGTIVQVDVADAKLLIAMGKAERADPLPGEPAE